MAVIVNFIHMQAKRHMRKFNGVPKEYFLNGISKIIEDCHTTCHTASTDGRF